jgi:hypothetical protein
MDEQIETRRAKGRTRYANMTPKQRQAIHDSQNACNMKPEQRKQKWISTKHIENCATTLYIKIEPFYNSMDDSP